MKCNICEIESEEGLLLWGQGFACSENCAQIAALRRKNFHDELDAEKLTDKPDNLRTHDFSLKLAVKWLRSLSDSDRKTLTESNPVMLVPEVIVLDFKKNILRNLHHEYYSSVEHHGVDRLFSSGTYCLRRSVPKEEIIRAAQKAELLEVTL